MIVQFRYEKVSNHGSIPITIDCIVVAFIVFEEGFHQLIKRTKQGTVNSRKAASFFVRLVDGEERWEVPDAPQDVLSQNWRATEQNRTVICMVLKAKANDRRKILTLSRDEFRGP
ncbi:uncharacterized protein TNCV_2715081 [Trichonephila clavipes]|nr:uncharacterized protein TNCV_2715081 [Trichonephila clavipes]